MMRLTGKLTQLASISPLYWGEFVYGWMKRNVSRVVPCVLPHANRIVYIPLQDFYETYGFFSESEQGRRELGFFLSKLRQGDVIYDIGAYRGAYSSAAKAALGEKVEIHLFEPLVENFDRVSAIAELNKFQKYKINNQAVGSGQTIRGVIRPEDGMLRSGGHKEIDTLEEMPSTSVDAYAAKHAFPTVLKIDVEGFEQDVLEGACECLRKHAPRIWLELHPRNLESRGINWKTILSDLELLGYTVTLFSDYELPNRESGFHVWCER